MSTVTENITPAKAQEYYNTSRGNRPISKVFIRSYADTMKRGGWKLNGVPIIFDNEGHLLDGHHRLLAVIEAGIPVRFDVYRGAPVDAFTTYDTGRHRTVGQILAMQGVKHYNRVGSIVDANEALILYGRLVSNNAVHGEIRRTLADAYSAYCKDRKGFDDTASYICSLQDKCRIITASWAGGLFYFLTHTGGYEEHEVRPFLDCLFTLRSEDVPAAALLQEAITKSAIGGKKLELETLWVYIVKSWNSYVTGKTLKILKYDNKREELPKLILR